jgi:hypothetical protein
MSLTSLTGVASAPRSVAAAAAQTIALVLNEDAAVPDGDEDIQDLVLMLRGHIMQLGPAVHRKTGPLAGALGAAQDLAATEMPAEYVPARVYLRNLAKAVQALLAEMVSEQLPGRHPPPREAVQAHAAKTPR